MGLDTTHDCFSGGYHLFSLWRTGLAKAAGLSTVVKREYGEEWEGYEVPPPSNPGQRAPAPGCAYMLFPVPTRLEAVLRLVGEARRARARQE